MLKKILDILKTSILILYILYIIFFAIENSEVVKLSLIFTKIEIRLFLIIALSIAFGYLLGILTSSFKIIGNYFTRLKDKKKIETLEKEKAKQKEQTE